MRLIIGVYLLCLLANIANAQRFVNPRDIMVDGEEAPTCEYIRRSQSFSDVLLLAMYRFCFILKVLRLNNQFI